MCHSQETVDIQGTFLRLDTAIKASPKYVWSKQLHIDGLEERLRTAIEPMTRYSVSRELFGEFRSYKNDSAFFYLQVAIREAQQMRVPTLLEIACRTSPIRLLRWGSMRMPSVC